MNQQGRNLSRPQTAEDSDALPPVGPGGIGLSTDLLWLQIFFFFFWGWSVSVAHGWVICCSRGNLPLTSRYLFVQLLQLTEQLLQIVDGGKKLWKHSVKWFIATRDSHAVTGAELMFLSITQHCWLSQIFYVLLSSRFTVAWPMWLNPFIYWKRVVNVGRLWTQRRLCQT